MSKASFVEFYTKFIHTDETLKAKLAEASSEDEFMSILAPLAEKAGIEFSMKDVSDTISGELNYVLENLRKSDGNLVDQSGKFFNPLGSRIFAMGNEMGTCHC